MRSSEQHVHGDEYLASTEQSSKSRTARGSTSSPTSRSSSSSISPVRTSRRHPKTPNGGRRSSTMASLSPGPLRKRLSDVLMSPRRNKINNNADADVVPTKSGRNKSGSRRKDDLFAPPPSDLDRSSVTKTTARSKDFEEYVDDYNDSSEYQLEDKYNDDDSDDDSHSDGDSGKLADFLSSPKLARDIMKKKSLKKKMRSGRRGKKVDDSSVEGAAIFSPIRTMTKLGQHFARSSPSATRKKNRSRDYDDDDDDNSRDMDRSCDSNDLLEDEDVMVLLCRELQLIDDDDDE